MNFAERLNALMQSNGVTKYRISKIVGCSATTVANWLNGTAPTGEYLQKLSAFFGVSVDYLLGNEENPPVQEVQGVDVKDALQQLEEILSADTALFDGTCLTEEDRLKAYGGIQFLKAQLAARAKNDKNKGNG